MMKEKIFKLHRHKSSSSSSSSSSTAGSSDVSGQKFDFTFSNIQALQVPKGWDKIFLSLVSYESGKTVRKSQKMPVKNGTCRWTETLSESIWISDHNNKIDSSKDVEEFLLKFLVSTGSSRNGGTLGETTLNLSAFLSSESPILVSLPLQKCNYGTILQVEVRCLTPKKNLRDEKWNNMHAEFIENRAEKSDSNNSDNPSRPVELSSRETSFSASISRYSFDSVESSNDTSSYSSYSSPHRPIKSFHSLQNGYSATAFKEANEAEARMWEQNARKLSVDLEILRKELSDQKETNENLSSQLNKTQESNIELISLLQEMEENSCRSLELEGEISVLKSKLDEKIIETEIENDVKNRILKEFVLECNAYVLAAKSDSKGVDRLKEKVTELEKDCEELTQENLELVFELKELRNSNNASEDSNVASRGKLELLQSQSFSFLDFNLDFRVEKSREKSEIVEFRDEKMGRDEKAEIALSDCSSTSVSDMIRRSGSIDSHVSDDNNNNNKHDVMKLMEAESNETELAEHLHDMQEENIYLSERVSGLEAQLRYLTDKTESNRTELQNAEYQVKFLYNQIEKLEGEIESRKIDTKDKLEEIEKRLFEAQEECISLSKINTRLESTTERLIEEYNLMHKFNEELRERKLKLQDRECSGEESSILHMQVQKVVELQNEVLDLRTSVKETNFRNQFLKASFESVSRENEELKRGRVSILGKVSRLEKELLQAQICVSKKNAVEEKLLRLEGDMFARDALSVDYAETKNELNRIKIVNSQFLMRVKSLENVREDLRRRVQILEEENEGLVMQQVQVCNESDCCNGRSLVAAIDYGSRIQVLENELVEALQANDMYKAQLESCAKNEGELQEIRERYLEISMKYAEVESQREQLVMKLKALNS
ncbi:hypothetical protein ABFX02_06G161200 [Erythranthe guttata]